MTTIKTTILDFVEKNKIKMVPRWQVLLYAGLGVVSLLFLFLLLVFVVSLMLFVLSKYGVMYLPLFGFGATLAALQSVPLLLFGSAIVLVVLVEILARTYAFSFKKPIFITVLIVLTSATVISFLIALTPIHKEINNYAREHNIGFVSRVYERPRPIAPHEKKLTVLRGTISATTSDTLTIELFDRTQYVVYSTNMNVGLPSLSLGDDVVVAGTFLHGRFEILHFRSAAKLPFRESARGERLPSKEMLR